MMLQLESVELILKTRSGWNRLHLGILSWESICRLSLLSFRPLVSVSHDVLNNDREYTMKLWRTAF